MEDLKFSKSLGNMNKDELTKAATKMKNYIKSMSKTSTIEVDEDLLNVSLITSYKKDNKMYNKVIKFNKEGDTITIETVEEKVRPIKQQHMADKELMDLLYKYFNNQEVK